MEVNNSTWAVIDNCTICKGYTHNFKEFVIFRSDGLGVFQIRLQVPEGAVHLLQRLLNDVHGDAWGTVNVDQLLVERQSIGKLLLDDIYQIVEQRCLIFGIFCAGQLLKRENESYAISFNDNYTIFGEERE